MYGLTRKYLYRHLAARHFAIQEELAQLTAAALHTARARAPVLQPTLLNTHATMETGVPTQRRCPVVLLQEI